MTEKTLSSDWEPTRRILMSEVEKTEEDENESFMFKASSFRDLAMKQPKKSSDCAGSFGRVLGPIRRGYWTNNGAIRSVAFRYWSAKLN